MSNHRLENGIDPLQYDHGPLIASMPLQPATPMEMLNRALMSGAAPETLEKLLVLQERWEKNQGRRAFEEAMVKAKAELPGIVKNRAVSFGAGRAAYNYEDLGEIERTIVPILSEHGLSYRFRTDTITKPGVIIVTCIVAHEGGYYEENTLSGPPDNSGNKNQIQAIGSTVTYLQRYALKAALGLAASKDDDGNAGKAKIDGQPVEEAVEAGELLNAEQMEYVWEKAREYCDPEVQQEWIEMLVKTVGHTVLAEVPASLFEMLRQKIITWPKTPAAPEWKTQK